MLENKMKSECTVSRSTVLMVSKNRWKAVDLLLIGESCSSQSHGVSSHSFIIDSLFFSENESVHGNGYINSPDLVEFSVNMYLQPLQEQQFKY